MYWQLLKYMKGPLKHNQPNVSGFCRERTTNTSSQEVNIQGLKPGTEYEFRVVTVNRDGPSVTPAVLPVRTKQEGKGVRNYKNYTL